MSRTNVYRELRPIILDFLERNRDSDFLHHEIAGAIAYPVDEYRYNDKAAQVAKRFVAIARESDEYKSFCRQICMALGELHVQGFVRQKGQRGNGYRWQWRSPVTGKGKPITVTRL